MTTVDQLVLVTADELLQSKNLGEDTLKEVREILRSVGKSLFGDA